MTTPGQAIKLQIACIGFYTRSRVTPAFTTAEAAQTYLDANQKDFHPVLPQYSGQQWGVHKMEIQP